MSLARLRRPGRLEYVQRRAGGAPGGERAIGGGRRPLQALRTGEPCPAGWRPGERTLSDARVTSPPERLPTSA